MPAPRSLRCPTLVPTLVGVAVAALPTAADAIPSAVTPVPFADAAATNSLDLVTQPDGRVALAWTHAVNRGGVGFALRPATDVFANGIVQDLTGDNVSALGLGDPGGDQPLRLVRTGSGTNVVVHRLGPSGLDGGVSRNVGLDGSRTYESCPDGSDAIITETAPSGGAQSLLLSRASGFFTGWSGTHDDDSSVGLDTTCAGGTLSVAVTRDTDTGAPQTERASVHTFLATGAAVERIRLGEPAGGSLGQSRIAQLADGRVFLVVEFDNADGTYGVAIATSDPGATTATTTASTIPGADLRDVAVDGTGRLLVLYDAHAPSSTDNDDPGISTVASTTPGATTSVTTPLTTTPDDRFRRFQTGHPDGAVRLVTEFTDNDVPPDDDRIVISGLTGVPGQTDDAPVTVRPPSPEGQFALQLRAAYLPSGDLVAAWGASDGKIVEGGIDTGVPPTLGSVSVPGAVVAGEPVVLEMDPSDPMGLASAGWTVGGTERAGARVTVSFPAAGTQTVTAAAVDRAGNRSETTRTIRVLPADAVAPTPPPAPITVPGPTVLVPAPAPPAVARDRRAPRITGLSQRPSRLSPRATVLRMRVRADETASLDLELIGRVRRGRDRGTLVVSTARVARLTRNRFRTVPLRLRPGLVRLVEKRRLQVRAIATDASGNRRTRTVTVRRR